MTAGFYGGAADSHYLDLRTSVSHYRNSWQLYGLDNRYHTTAAQVISGVEQLGRARGPSVYKTSLCKSSLCGYGTGKYRGRV